jgi:hypothetical protein
MRIGEGSRANVVCTGIVDRPIIANLGFRLVRVDAAVVRNVG